MDYLSPDGFFGIQILPNSISGGAVPQTLLGELTVLPDLLVDWVGGYSLPIPFPLDIKGVEARVLYFQIQLLATLCVNCCRYTSVSGL